MHYVLIIIMGLFVFSVMFLGVDSEGTTALHDIVCSPDFLDKYRKEHE